MNARIAIYVALALIMALSWGASCVMFHAARVGELVGPLEDRGFEALTLVTVGTGSAYENPERLGPASAVGWGNHIVLVDAGRGIAEAMRLAKLPLAQPGTVLLTNLLPENTVGLDDFLYTGWLAGRTEPLRVIGPPGTAALASALESGHASAAGIRASAMGLPEAGARIEALEVGDGWSEEVAGLEIRAGALSGGPLPALAFRFERDGRSLVISGTGWAPDALAEFASGADMLLHEAVYVPSPEEAEEAGVLADPERLRGERELHTSILDVGDLASRARIGTLVLVRMRPPPFFSFQVTNLVSQSFDGPILIPDDGQELEP